MGRRVFWIGAIGLVVAAMPATAPGAVRLVEDEVIFSLRAPEADRVFLVGDFNNWNATLERMDKVGDQFQVRLFLLAGVYRYKFVVDGKWIADPDNPSEDPAKGSYLALEERSGMLVMASDAPVSEPGELFLKPSFRYIGIFRHKDDTSFGDHLVDAFFNYERKNIRTNASFKTKDDSWDLDPVTTEINFERGFLEASMGDARLKAFENHTVWSSSDPLQMFGAVGIHGYNAGYERKGFTFESAQILKATLRAIYADKLGTSDQPVAISASSLAGFAAGGSTDTTVYAYAPTFDDEDIWGMELFFDAGGLKAGYVNRRNRGMHPGLLAGVTRLGNGTFDVTTSSTVEFWSANLFWVGYGVSDYVTVTGAYGTSDAHIRRTATSSTNVASLGDITIMQTVFDDDRRVRLQETHRWRGEVAYKKNPLKFSSAFEWKEFDFAGDGTADIIEATMDARYIERRWQVDGMLCFVDQDYGTTSPDFHVLTPSRNFWLDHRDRLGIADMAAFDLAQYTNVSLGFAWGNDFGPDGTIDKGGVRTARVDAAAMSENFFEALHYAEGRVAVEQRFPRAFYLQGHGRVAWYNKDAWNLEETFLAPYLEIGYRDERWEISAGFGFDPVVFDPVTNEYDDIGRLEHLRRAIPIGSGPLRRDQSTLLGTGLRSLEEELEETNTLKLEVILTF